MDLQVCSLVGGQSTRDERAARLALAGRMDRSRNPLVLLLGALGCVAMGGFVVTRNSVIPLTCVVVLGIIALLVLDDGLIRWPDDPDAQARIVKWTLAALAVHLAVGLLITSSEALVGYLGPDARTYNFGARAIVDHWNTGVPMPSLPAGKEGFYFVLAAVYWAFGASTFGGVALNAVFGAALVPVVSDTTHRLFGPAAARYAAPLVVLVPGMIIWTSQLLKEACFLLLLALAANAAARLVDRVSPLPVLVLGLSLPALLTMRGQVGLVMLGGLVLGSVLGRKAVSGGLFGAALAAGVVALVVGLGVGASGYGKAVGTNLQEANAVRQNLAASASSGFETETDISTVGRALSFLPQGLLVATIGPFPWQLVGARQLPAIPDVVAWWYLVAVCCTGVAAARRTSGRRVLVIVVPAVAALAVIALVVGNYGTIVRERMQVLVLLAPVMALGIATRRARREAAGEPVPSLR